MAWPDHPAPTWFPAAPRATRVQWSRVAAWAWQIAYGRAPEGFTESLAVQAGLVARRDLPKLPDEATLQAAIHDLRGWEQDPDWQGEVMPVAWGLLEVLAPERRRAAWQASQAPVAPMLATEEQWLRALLRDWMVGASVASQEALLGRAEQLGWRSMAWQLQAERRIPA